jgi:hypothetical protein
LNSLKLQVLFLLDPLHLPPSLVSLLTTLLFPFFPLLPRIGLKTRVFLVFLGLELSEELLFEEPLAFELLEVELVELLTDVELLVVLEAVGTVGAVALEAVGVVSGWRRRTGTSSSL